MDGDGQGDACDADADGDFMLPPFDCDDMDASISPVAVEVCDGLTDEDCDELVDEDCPVGAEPTLCWWELDEAVSYTSLTEYVLWNAATPDEHSSFPGGDFDGAFVDAGQSVCATLTDLTAPGVHTLLLNVELVDASGMDWACTGGSNPLNWRLGGSDPLFSADGTPLTVDASNAVPNEAGTGCDLEFEIVISP